MNKFEYRVIATPTEPRRAGMFRTGQAVAMDAVNAILNEQGEHGWEYIRSETLVSTTKKFLRRKTTKTEEVMVFRRSLGRVDAAEDQARLVLTDPLPTEPLRVTPRRVKNSDAVARVKAGGRRLHVVAPGQSVVSDSAMAAMASK